MLNRFCHLGILYHGTNLRFAADDGWVASEKVDFLGIESAYLIDVKIAEGLAERFSFVEDAFPRKAGLKATEGKKLEEAPVVVAGHAPFVIVVVQVGRILGVGPGTAGRVVGPEGCVVCALGLAALAAWTVWVESAKTRASGGLRGRQWILGL